MKKICKLLGIFMTLSFLAYSQELTVSGVYYPNTPIRLTAKVDGVWKIESKPSYSNASLVQENGVATFTADTVGNFDLAFTYFNDDEEQKILKSIKIEKFNQYNEQFDEKQIYDIIVESFNSKNYTLLKYGISNLKVNYPSSELLHKSYIKALELSMDKQYYEDGKKYLEVLLYEYKYSLEEKKKYLQLAYEFFNYFDKEEEKKYYLIQLAEYDDKYKEVLGKLYIGKKQTEEQGIVLLEKLYKKYFSKQLAAFLGDYYLNKGKEAKALEYYGNSDRVAYAKIMINRLDDKDFDLLIKDFDEDELAQLEVYQVEKSNLDKMKNYYKYAQNNIKKDRLELAEIYLNRIVNQELNNDLKKDAAEKLIELYVIQGRYSNAIRVYDSYLDANMTLKDVKNLYNKGLIYVKLDNQDGSLKIFNEIVEKYPKTIWARKAQISIFKINKEKNNL